MKPVLLLSYLFFGLHCDSIVQAQKSILSGVVKRAGQPVSGLTVYTSFYTTTTDALGRYSISLDGCATCRPGNKISILTYNEECGSFEQLCVIPNDYKHDFSITCNPGKITVWGMVQNSATGDALPNILVKVMGDIEMDAVKTDGFGLFKFNIRRSQLEKLNEVRLQVQDPGKNYKPLRSVPELFNINSFITLRMVVGRPVSLNINDFTTTDICVNKNDLITIEASGQIRVGAFVGTSDPDGRTAGLFGASLEAYNIVGEFNHAALLYRIQGESQWKVAGKRRQFVAGNPGCIQLQVNDNKKDDNYGNYIVEITVEKN
jgi:hypothetical protein